MANTENDRVSCPRNDYLGHSPRGHAEIRRVCSAYLLSCNPNPPEFYTEIYLLAAAYPKRIKKKKRELLNKADTSLCLAFDTDMIIMVAHQRDFTLSNASMPTPARAWYRAIEETAYGKSVP